jgi:hypothetical protein
MDDVALARVLGAGRVVLGAGLLVAPARLGRPWIGAVADTPGAQVALRGLGVRDLVLGGIALHLAPHGAQGGRAAHACVVSDAVDLGATLAARRALPPSSAGVLALAGGAAVAGALLGRRLIAAG